MAVGASGRHRSIGELAWAAGRQILIAVAGIVGGLGILFGFVFLLGIVFDLLGDPPTSERTQFVREECLLSEPDYVSLTSCDP